ncbi:MAG: CPBP family intramembrane metalloprotease [Ignavibacterium sp.]|nr:MAG: CPBP family intramembrane metalloprotease [Ignavibacterium sp.]
MSDLEENPNQEEEKEPEEHNEYAENRTSVHNVYPLLSPVAAAALGLIGGFFLYQFVGGLLTLIIFGFDIEGAPADSLRLMTMAGQILFILLPALLFSKWIYGDVSDIISLKVPNWVELFIFSAGILILTPLLQTYMFIQNFLIEQLASNYNFVNTIKSFFDSLNALVEKTYGNLLKADSIIELLLVVLVIAAVPAVCEEVMFRGYIQKSLGFKLKPFWAALVTAIFFGFYHFNPYGLLPLICLGLYFGFAAYISDSLVVPIFLHFLNNFSAVLLFYIIGDDQLVNSDITGSEELGSNIFLFVTLAILFTIIIIVIKKYYLKFKTVQE